VDWRLWSACRRPPAADPAAGAGAATAAQAAASWVQAATSGSWMGGASDGGAGWLAWVAPTDAAASTCLPSAPARLCHAGRAAGAAGAGVEAAAAAPRGAPRSAAAPPPVARRAGRRHVAPAGVQPAAQ